MSDYSKLSGRVLQFFGYFNSQLMFWGRYEPKNFGDWIGPYIFQKVTGKNPQHTWLHWYENKEVLFTAGSIVRNIGYPDRAVVWGSGIISIEDKFERPKLTLAVRGPRTKKRFQELGYPCPSIYGDPAVLMPFFYHPKIPIKNELGIIPHYTQYRDVMQMFGSNKKIKVIDVAQKIEDVIDEIVSCSILISSSLHGIIISHSYRRKCAWVSFGDGLVGDNVKFYDYADSVQLEYIQPGYKVSCFNSVSELVFLAEKQDIPCLYSLQKNIAEVCPFGDIKVSVKMKDEK